MDRRTKIGLLIAGGVIAIAAIVYFIFFQTPNAPAPVNTNTPIETGGGSLNVNNGAATTPTPPPPPREVSQEVKNQASAQITATTFAERLGSYSNQNNFTNFTDLAPFTIPATYNYIQGTYRTELQKTIPSANTYYGVTTKVIGSTLTSSNETSASLTLNVQKAETGTVTRTSYLTLEVALIKQNGSWLISEFRWQ